MNKGENRYKIVHETAIFPYIDIMVIAVEEQFEPILLKEYIADTYLYDCYFKDRLFRIETKESVPLHRIVDSIVDDWSDIDGNSWVQRHI